MQRLAKTPLMVSGDLERGASMRVNGATVFPHAMAFGATGDPVTPYDWAKQMNSEIPGSVLLTREGNGHTSYGITDCIDSAADRYLLNLALPAPHSVCSS